VVVWIKVGREEFRTILSIQCIYVALIVCERKDDDDCVLSCHEVRGVVEGRAVVIAGRASIDLGRVKLWTSSVR
jgi:hypothetical protein